MKTIKYVVQSFGKIRAISEKEKWYDVDTKDDKQEAIASWKEFKEKLPKVRLIERTLIEKRLR